ncbi:heat shock protein DnaJ, partial [Lophiostoma macrostomum CBS 122681]
MAPPVPTDDYYHVLEVEQDAPHETIVRSYRKLALKRHPDRNPGSDRAVATAEFQLLGEAYDTLSDATKRRDYD